MCQHFNVKRSGFYDYLKNRIHRKNELEAELIDWIKKISQSSHFSYGNRRMTKALHALGYRIGRRKTRRLMKVAHIFVRYRKKYKVTTNNNHQHSIYENVLQCQFTVDHPIKHMFLTLHTFEHKRAGFKCGYWLKKSRKRTYCTF